jgi:methyl-accepting chemotaxis protein
LPKVIALAENTDRIENIIQDINKSMHEIASGIADTNRVIQHQASTCGVLASNTQSLYQIAEKVLAMAANLTDLAKE